MIWPALIYLVGALIIFLARKNRGISKYLAMSISAIAAINVFLVKVGTNVSVNFLDFKLTLIYADKLSLFVAYIFVIIGFLAFMYGFYLEDTKLQIYAMLYVGGALGVVFAGDFFTIYGFWELMAIASTALVWLNKDEKAYSAGVRYIIMHLIGGAILLAGIFLYYAGTGHVEIPSVLSGMPTAGIKGLAGQLIMIGVGLNAAFILLHTWLPDTYPKAPFAASCFMSVYTTKTAVYMLARTSAGFPFVAYMGAVMAVFGATFALMQGQGRKLLSYHIISQVGYMVAAIGMGDPIGVNGGILHLFNHILYKSLLFMGIGAVIYVTGEEDLTKMGGLIRKMPVTTTCVVIAALAITGVPFFNGFTSKALIFEASEIVPTAQKSLSIFMGDRQILELLLELAAVGTFLSFFKFTWFGFLRPNPEFAKKAKEVPIMMQIPMIVVASMCFIVGVYPWVVANLLPFEVHGGFYNFARLSGSAHLIIPIAFGFIVFNKFFEPHMREIRDFDRAYIRVSSWVPYLFEFSRLIDNGINWFYRTIAEVPGLISIVFDRVNDFLEITLEKGVSLFNLIVTPINTFTIHLTDVLFVLWIDFWLFIPTAKLHTETNEEELSFLGKRLFKSSSRAIDYADHMASKISSAVNFVESNVVDKTGTQLSHIIFPDESAREKNRLSYISNIIDKTLIDGFVNGVAALIYYLGERSRRIQTGLVQNYALIIAFVVSILLFVLSIRGSL